MSDLVIIGWLIWVLLLVGLALLIQWIWWGRRKNGIDYYLIRVLKTSLGLIIAIPLLVFIGFLLSVISYFLYFGSLPF